MTFRGLMTALVTPFHNGVLDEAAFRLLVRRQVDAGVDGLVPCGTTGEAPTLPSDEHIEVVRWTVEEAKGRVPVLAGIGSNATATAIRTAKSVEALGVQGVLATAPYYNKPTQEGLYRHFRAIAEAVAVEVCLYDVPGRSVVRILPETVERLAEIENITTLKDATADMANATDVLRRCGQGLSVLSGDDFSTFPFLALGGVGCISVASNVAPKQMSELVSTARNGNLDEARSHQRRLFPLFQQLFCESNPIPVKAALAKMGLIHNELRLPLCPMSSKHEAKMCDILRDLGVLDDR